MPAPAVQDLNTLVSQYKTALAPQSAAIDNEVAANEASGTTQVAGINAAKSSAFGDITQAANDRGGYFSGFTPDQEAKYTAATYLPALATLQSTIAGTRASLLGKKADIAASANTSALGEQKTEQNAFDTYQQQQEAEVNAAAEAEKARQFTAGQNALNRNQPTPTTPAQQQATDFNGANTYLKSKVGKDGKVSPATFLAAKQAWVDAGYSAASFNSNFSNYANNSYGTYKTDYGL